MKKVQDGSITLTTFSDMFRENCYMNMVESSLM